MFQVGSCQLLVGAWLVSWLLLGMCWMSAVVLGIVLKFIYCCIGVSYVGFVWARL